jgi:ankyrin repeat protein
MSRLIVVFIFLAGCSADQMREPPRITQTAEVPSPARPSAPKDVVVSAPPTFRAQIQSDVFANRDPAPLMNLERPAHGLPLKLFDLAKAAKTAGEQRFFLALLSDPKQIFVIDDRGGRLFHWLAEHDDFGLANTLLAAGVTQGLKAVDHNGHVPLHLARSGAMVQALWSSDQALVTDMWGQTPLIYLAAKNQVSALSTATKLACKGITAWQEISGRNSINAVDKLGRTALHYAALNANLEGVDALVSCPSINLDIADSWQRSPLHYAATLHDGFAIGYSLTKNFQYSGYGINPKVNINAKDFVGNTPLHLAYRCQCEAGVELLRDTFRADVSLENDAGETPLTGDPNSCPRLE